MNELERQKEISNLHQIELKALKAQLAYYELITKPIENRMDALKFSITYATDRIAELEYQQREAKQK